MLKRNKMLVAFMLVAVLCVSVGFATLTDTLTANGTFALNVESKPGEGGEEENPIVKKFDENVYFSAAAFDKTNSDVHNDTNDELKATFSDDAVTITIPDGTFSDAEQYVTFTATIASTATYKVTATVDTIENENDEYFTVEADFAGNASATINESNGTDAETVTLTIKVTLDNVPTAGFPDGVEFKVSVKATPAA